MKEILINVFIFYIGLGLGFLLREWLQRRASYNGIIHITEEKGKRLYSLELDDYPEIIAFKKEVIFKVDVSEIESDRD